MRKLLVTEKWKHQISKKHLHNDKLILQSDTATAVSTERSVDALASSYPAEFAHQVGRIEREMEAEELGVKKPSSNDRLLVARTVAFEKGDMATVEACDKIQERRRASRRDARARKKVRKAALKECVARTHGLRDPNSDNE